MLRSLGRNPYSVHPGVLMVQKWITDLPAKTGRSFEEWLQYIKKSGLPTNTAGTEQSKK